jgi:cytoskeletal protein CcmA (bactofilin family)
MFNKSSSSQQKSNGPTKLPNLDDLNAHIKLKNESGSDTSPVYLISEGTTVIGDIISDHGIRVSGKVKGTIKSNGKCVIASTAEIEGDVKAVDADISGLVSGEITVSNKLILRDSARIVGKVTTAILNVEDGAKLSGTCEMKMESIDSHVGLKKTSQESPSSFKPEKNTELS